MQPLYLLMVFRANLEIMKNLLSVALLLVLSTAGVQAQPRTVAPFSGVSAAEGVSVYLKNGDKESVRVEVTGTSADNVLTEVSGSYLKVHMKEGRYKGSIDVKVYVTYVRLTKISASSAGNIYSDGPIKATTLGLSCSSAGTIEVQAQAESITADASSAGDIELTGTTKSFSAEVSSAGEIDAYDLESDKVVASAVSAGSIKVSVVSELKAEASSGGSVRYRGNPTKTNTNSSSGGSVKKSN